jgi:hypothetical protein
MYGTGQREYLRVRSALLTRVAKVRLTKRGGDISTVALHGVASLIDFVADAVRPR